MNHIFKGRSFVFVAMLFFLLGLFLDSNAHVALGGFALTLDIVLNAIKERLSK